MNKTRWVRIIGDGPAFSGPCLVTHILVWPHADTQYVDIYDGRDATSGKKFVRIDSAFHDTQLFRFDPGIPFDMGIYVDAEHVEDETTVVFIPV